MEQTTNENNTMGGTTSRNKGQRGEREVIALLQSAANEVFAFFGVEPPALSRNLMQAGHGGFDIAGLPGFGVEVKYQETGLQQAWWDQAVAQADAASVQPVLFFRKSRQPWRVMARMRFAPAGTQEFDPVPAIVSAEFFVWYLKNYLAAYLHAEGFAPAPAQPAQPVAAETPPVTNTDAATPPAPEQPERVPELPECVDGDFPQAVVFIEEARKRSKETCSAREMYQSPQFKLAVEYAERSGLPWFAFGTAADCTVAAPETLLSPYTGGFSRASAARRANIQEEIDTIKNRMRTRNAILFGWTPAGNKVLPDDPATWKPCDGMKQPEAVAWLKSALDTMPDKG